MASVSGMESRLRMAEMAVKRFLCRFLHRGYHYAVRRLSRDLTRYRCYKCGRIWDGPSA